jgi:hypothetical protein
MVKSEATTVVPSQNVSTIDLPTHPKEEKDSQPVAAEAESTSSSEPAEPAEPAEKTEEVTAVEEAKAFDKPDADSEVEYPHGPKLVIITIALCLSVFLVALVRTAHGPLCSCNANTTPGQYYHRDCHSSNYRSLQSNKRCRLVWECVSPHDMRFSAYVRKILHFLSDQNGLSYFNLHL